MTLRRPVLLRTAGFLTLAGLVGLNGWLVLLNLAKHDRLPTAFGDLPGLAAAAGEASGGSDPDTGETDDAGSGGVADGEAAAFTTEATVVTGADRPGTIEVDQWPGGRGPVPDGPPSVRQIRLLEDGRLRLTGSAPNWSVVSDLRETLARRLGRDPSTILVDVTWHPKASPRLDDGEVVLDQPLRYQPGQIELSGEASAQLVPVISLVAANPELIVVVEGLVDDGDAGGAAGEVAAVALGRTTVVVEALTDGGVEAERVVTSVASADPDDPDEAGDRVLVRVENLLVFGPTS